MRWLICLLSLFIFAVEVLNPSTVFVREYVNFSSPSTFSISIKSVQAVQPVRKDSRPGSSHDKPAGQYVVASAVVPQHFIFSRPDQVQTTAMVTCIGEPHITLHLIQRPPAQA